MITNNALLERVDAFLKGINKQDRVCIIHDTDPDGVCSATIIAKCIERLRKKKIDLRLPMDKAQYGFTDHMISEIKKHRINKVITCDFSAENQPSHLNQIEQQAEILIIDHHKLANNITSSKTVLYKPQLFTTIDPPTYCTGKLAYDAAARVADVSDLDWVAASACIADIATAPWTEWLNSVFKKYKMTMKKDLFRTPIGQVAVTISSTEVYDVNLVGQCFDVFSKAKKPKDILKSKLGKYKKIIDRELNKHLKLFNRKAEHKKDLYIYELVSKYRVHSPMSTILGLKYPNRTILIINKTTDRISVSARRGDKKKPVNLLLERATAGIPESNAGGHTPAAGAGFPKTFLDEFKRRIWKLEQA